MTYTASTRDRYRLAVWATTASVAAGAIAATGWAAGAAAHDQAQIDAAQQARQADQDAQAKAEYAAWQEQYGNRTTAKKPRTIVRQRPTRTRVSTRYVTVTSSVAAVGPGGTVSAPTTSTTPTVQTQQTSSGGNGGGGGGGGQTSTPPPPPPPPTPTSGS